MYYFILKSILGSIVGSSFYTWWQDTRMGVWFQKKLNDTLDALDWEVLKKEEKWRKAYPNLALQMEEILAEREDIALAMSSDNPTTLLAFIPAFGTNSNNVTIGPLLKPMIFPSTPYSESVFSNFDMINTEYER